MRTFRPWHRFLLFLGAVGLVFGTATLLSAAQAQPQSQSQAQVQPVKTDSDITRAELRNFDQYLDNHPEVAEALRKNPKLVNNVKWVNQHPQLKDWLEDHPNARRELKENPQAFMRRERGFEERGGDITRTELRNFDQYLDNHPEVGEALRKDPGLINDAEWVNQHPQLKDWLEDHPNARKELKENPQAFMRRERGFEERGGDITRTELRNFDQYLDNHPEVAEALRKNPGLINDAEWVNQHPHLKDWLEDHPNARRELKQHPRAFMHREGGFEKREEERHPVKRH